MTEQKHKIIKRKSVEEIEQDIYSDEISLLRNILRVLKKKNPEKARRVLEELRAEVV